MEAPSWQPVSRLLIVDGQSRTRRALRALLATCTEFTVIGEAADGEEALAQMAQLHPDLVLLDVQLPRLDGIAVTAQITTRWPTVRVVTQGITAHRREEALAAGADAFVLKGAPFAEFLGALRSKSSVP